MNGKLGRFTKRAFALLLCVLLCAQAALALAEGETTAPTETTAETATPTVEPAATETPTEPPATETTAPSPTTVETVSPTDSASIPPDSATPGESSTPAPEDTAPTCDIPDCTHVMVDADGKTVALCPLGEWMLAHGLGTPEPMMAMSTMALFSATDPSAIALTDSVTTIYRSGTYVLSGGTGTTELVISPNLAVAILLQSATINKMTVGSGVSLQMGFTGKSLISKLHTGDGNLLLDGTGSLTVLSVDDPGSGQLTMAGGSIQMPAGTVSQNGNTCYDFSAVGATAAIVDGVSFPFTTPDSADMAHLWLAAPDAGESYRSTVTGGVLIVLSAPEEPSGADVFDMSGADDLNAEANKSYLVFASTAPNPHTLTVGQSGVSLVLDGVDFSTTAAVVANQTTRVHLRSDSRLLSVSGSASVNFSGAGVLDVGTLALNALNCANTVKLRFGTSTGVCFSGWQSLVSPVNLDTVTSLAYNGHHYAMAYATGDPLTVYTPLPAPATGMKYDLQLDGTTLEATQIPIGTQTLVLGGSDLTIGASGSYVIASVSGATGNLIIPDGLNVSLTLRSMRTSGRVVTGEGTTVTAVLEGSNHADGGVTLGNNTTLAFGGSGALTTANVTALGAATTTISAYTNVSLTAGSTLGGSSLVPTVINVTDSGSMPVVDTAITLRVGSGTPIRTTTAGDGHVTLWAKKAISNASVVVLSQANTYADILTGDPANPDALPVISDVVIHGNSYVTFTATNAQTFGVQYYVNRSGATMPDTYDASALTEPRLYGQVNFPGLKKGDIVIFRAYAARQSGQTLSADTADAFQFSDSYTFTAADPRKVYTLADQSKEYDLYAFRFAAGLIPKGATVTYYKDGKALSGAPTDVGAYTATVAIPSDNPDYIPGVVTVNVTITPKVVWIYPEAASKLKGQQDPEFYYTWSDMFGDDEVTGLLTRSGGERYGNYPYLTDGLSAPSYYELRIDPESPMFFIDWGPGHYIKVDPLSIIDPVHQVIEYSDGTKLDLILRTADKLSISNKAYGALVIDTETRKTRPFTPELRLKHGYDQAMIILQAEPEINDDGGYATDEDGNVELRGRTLSMTAFHLSRFKSQRITALGFRLDDAMCVLDLNDLTSDTVREAMSEAGMPMIGTHYQITLDPVNSVSDLKDYPEDAQTAKALGAQMMGVRIELQNGATVLDISSLVPSARTMFDASKLLAEETKTSPEISEVTVGQQNGQTVDENSLTTDVMELVQKLLLDKLKALGTVFYYYAQKTETLDSQLVVPYTASEAEALPFTAVMKTSPYLMAKLHRNGLYGLGQTTLP